MAKTRDPEGVGTPRPLRIGTRGSALALAQSGQTAARLEAAGNAVEMVVVRTSGDKMAEVSLARVGGKGLFIKELEEALARGEIDLAIHSMKDVPAELPPGYSIGAVTARADERDVLVLREDAEPGATGVLDGDEALRTLHAGARIGTGSLRRRAQIGSRRADLVTVPIRGNVDTRLDKLRRGEVDAVVLAAAGVARLGLEIRTRPFDSRQFLPSPGQGALALECREGDDETRRRVSVLNDPATADACAAERAFLRELEASCVVPVAALARSAGDGRVSVEGLVANLDGTTILRGQEAGPAERAGRELAGRLIAEGARDVLAEVERRMSVS